MSCAHSTDRKKSTYWIFSFDQNVMDTLTHVSIDILRDTHLSCVWLDLEERVFVMSVKAIRQRVQQRAELRAICICGNNLEKTSTGRTLRTTIKNTQYVILIIFKLMMHH